MSAVESERRPKPDTSMYSETAKMFHAWCSHVRHPFISVQDQAIITRLEQLRRLHKESKHDECREGCLQLLERPYAPHYVRIRTLHLLADSESSADAPGMAVYYAKKALTLLEKLDGTRTVAKMLLAENTKILERFEKELAEAQAKLEGELEGELEETGMGKTEEPKAGIPEEDELKSAEPGDEQPAGKDSECYEEAFFKALKEQNNELRQQGLVLDDDEDELDLENDPVEEWIRQREARKQQEAAGEQLSRPEEEQSPRFVPSDTPGQFPKGLP